MVRNDDLESLRDLGPFDVILDPVGGNYAALNLKLLAQDGRWVLIGLMGGREARLDLAQVLAKRVQLLGSTLRSRDDQFKADLFSDLSQHVWPLFAEGRLSPQLARTFPIKDAETAFAELASNTVAGKVVLVIDESLS
ncbi:Zinc-binding dehydrogenase [compost metagenome]